MSMVVLDCFLAHGCFAMSHDVSADLCRSSRCIRLDEQLLVSALDGHKGHR
jgi:hypothetical protein